MADAGKPRLTHSTDNNHPLGYGREGFTVEQAMTQAIEPTEIARRLMDIWRRPFKEGDRYVIVQAADAIQRLAEENENLRKAATVSHS